MYSGKDKFIFLDVDGVLNSNDWYVRRKPDYDKHLEEKKKFSSGRDHSWEFDPKAVERLNKITDTTGAKIVVSSTWRSLPNIFDILKNVGITGEIIDITPEIYNVKICNTKEQIHASIPRGLEIDEWLETKVQKEIYIDDIDYIILDDDGDMLLHQKNKFIKTDRWVGLTDADVEEAIRILHREEWKDKEMVVYEALYNPMTYESSDAVLSIHRNKENAERVVKEHKMQCYKDWRELYQLDRLKKLHKQIQKGNLKYSDEYESLKCVHRFGTFEWWGVREIKIED